MANIEAIKKRVGSSDEIEDMKAQDREEDYRVDEAVNTLLKAEEIRQDTKLMEKVWPKLEAKKEAAQTATSLKDLRKLASKKASEEYDQKRK